MLDQEILKSMSPEQLSAIAARAQRRMDGVKIPKEKKPLDTVLRVHSSDPEGARRTVEAVLGTHVKDWKFVATQRDPAGGPVLEYRVRLRKSVPAAALTGELRTRLGPQATGVETR
jgi:hypothetical protein